MAFDYEKFIRTGKLPHIWCPGCGHGTIMKSLLRGIGETGIKKDDIVVVSGIGCVSRMPGYLDFNTLHTTHGRALAFATGIKMAKPNLTVIVVAGDGDIAAIGGNHLIHTCRRNIDITLLISNNYTYGMTGGQFSPTTPYGKFATTTPYGNPDPSFDLCKLSEAAGATFVARCTSYHAHLLSRLVYQAIMHKGFSVIDAITHCPITYGRRNELVSAVDNLRWQKEKSIMVQSASKMTPEQIGDRFIIGVLSRKETPEYTDEYAKIIEYAQKRNKL